MFLRRQRLECVWRAVERIWERKREEKKSRVKRPGSMDTGGETPLPLL